MQLDVPLEPLLAMLLASVRAAAWLLFAPPFNSRAIPAPVKALLSVAIALPVVPRLVADAPELEVAAITVAVAQQVLIGSALGFLCAMVFAAVQAAGDLIDLFGGFAMAFAFDPLTQNGNSVFGKLYHLTALTLLFASNGHLVLMHGFLRTYDVLPLGTPMSLSGLGELATSGLSQLFLAAVQIAGPLIAVLFLADVGLGLLTRIAPALNAFALGFPFKILLTLVLGGVGFAVLPAVVQTLTEQAYEMLGAAARP